MLALVLGVAAEAQQPEKVPRIGFVSARANPTPTIPDSIADALRQGLRDLGYIEGKNIVIEYRYLVINLKTAKQIGLTIPPNVLAWMDRVIK